MPPPKKSEPRPYERSAVPLAPAPAPTVQWAIGLVNTTRMGQPELQVVVYEIRGTECTAHPLPEGNHVRTEDALMDLRSSATQIFRFKRPLEVIAGRA